MGRVVDPSSIWSYHMHLQKKTFLLFPPSIFPSSVEVTSFTFEDEHYIKPRDLILLMKMVRSACGNYVSNNLHLSKRMNRIPT
ncbi:hypothetical protein GDO78_004221 [Eleutherodactylus coqui]|uniref:Uncharacterized protein n=1 Tax=Eleutherodactylus coqui TaxID=57060 RepID=A0A8J6JZG0_ELECQ|nr:hypothetical protein GDO78_004221 [Eleutherodactylus coqui]